MALAVDMMQQCEYKAGKMPEVLTLLLVQLRM